MIITAGELAHLVNGTLEGDSTIILTHPSKIEEGQVGSICFLANPKYEPYLYQSAASVVIVDRNFKPKQAVIPALLRVDNVYLTVSSLLSKFEETGERSYVISDKSEIHPTAVLGEHISIGAFVVIESNVSIGSGSQIGSQVFIGSNVKIGERVKLYPGVRIYKDCVIGNDCILHSNVVIGSDGFGYTTSTEGDFKKIAQIGNVVIHDFVEIGSNTTIDRGTMGSTVIGKGTKLDNLIQIAHNVQIGENTVIAAQTGIAGSTKIGNRCQIGGQVGISGHLTIADGTMIQAQSGVGSDLEAVNGKWYGSPALDYYLYLRAYSEFKKLPELRKKIIELEKLISAKGVDNLNEPKNDKA
ncbi:MAG: UDP-3-O-(3-hydroxymyristoyl)glucosamine N-acyltransferase [Bacteroidota bacterium]|nr:UDP-3-O-(3-hydroxymyristoyl)glucosamine N-acyltransferase [Bacteroidota bacterium]